MRKLKRRMTMRRLGEVINVGVRRWSDLNRKMSSFMIIFLINK